MKNIIILFEIIFMMFVSLAYSQSGWFQQQSGTGEFLKSIFFINSNTGWICGNNGKIIRTTNGGSNWIFQNSGTTNTLNSVFFLNENTGWCAGGVYDPDFISRFNIVKTTNRGDTWALIYDQPNFTSYFISVFFLDEIRGYAVEQGSTGFISIGGIWTTNNGGINWFLISNSSTANGNIQFTDLNTGYVLGKYWDDFQTDTAYILKSTNSGQTWNKMYQKPRTTFYSSHFINNNSGWVGGAYYLENFIYQNIILKTTNGGLNWEQINLNSNNYANTIFFANSYSGWITSSHVYHTTNGGFNWSYQSALDSNQYYRSMFFTDLHTGWITGSNGSIFKTITGGITSVINPIENISNTFYLYQNYPNPFNPNTTVKYYITITDFVTLKVYDILGNEVATLVNEKQNAGSYTIEFDAGNLPSGIYYYKLESGNFSEVRKMILLK